MVVLNIDILKAIANLQHHIRIVNVSDQVLSPSWSLDQRMELRERWIWRKVRECDE